MAEKTYNDEFWMDRCLELAKEAANIKEVPVGACLLYTSDAADE